jgi:Regulator of chromosome condensation (RCC1) repeat/PASTA domain/Divergent InlB B-repeat domain
MADRLTPVDVSGLGGGVTAIAAGVWHTCAVTGGAVKCWGRNMNAALGDGTTEDRHVPTDVVGLGGGVAAIAAGDFHTCVRTAAGSVKCWGRNAEGQVGDTTTTERRTPVDVSGLTSGVTAIAAGDLHSCGVTGEGRIKCWGWNANFQLGDGTNFNRSTPVEVIGFGPVPKTLSVTTGGTGEGTVTSEPDGVFCGATCSFDFEHGTQVTLSATAAGNSDFAGWSGACTGSRGCTLVMDRGRTVTATFNAKRPSKCVVPKVKGKTLAAAKIALARARCALGTVRRAHSTAAQKGRVIAQRPVPGKILAPGSKVKSSSVWASVADARSGVRTNGWALLSSVPPSRSGKGAV